MYQKKQNLSPTQLNKPTQFRFIEIEMYKALYHFRQMGLHPERILFKILTENELTNKVFDLDPTFKKELYQALHSYNFEPTNTEIIQYLRYRNLGVHKIRRYVPVAPKSLVQGGIYDIVPDYKPAFPLWHHQDAQMILYQWEHMKHRFNLFNEPVIHAKEIKEYDIVPETEKEYEEELSIFEKANAFLYPSSSYNEEPKPEQPKLTEYDYNLETENDFKEHSYQDPDTGHIPDIEKFLEALKRGE